MSPPPSLALHCFQYGTLTGKHGHCSVLVTVTGLQPASQERSSVAQAALGVHRDQDASQSFTLRSSPSGLDQGSRTFPSPAAHSCISGNATSQCVGCRAGAVLCLVGRASVSHSPSTCTTTVNSSPHEKVVRSMRRKRSCFYLGHLKLSLPGMRRKTWS